MVSISRVSVMATESVAAVFEAMSRAQKSESEGTEVLSSVMATETVAAVVEAMSRAQKS
jgi:hypothetical protein